jgi:epoxyqueuosine reductase
MIAQSEIDRLCAPHGLMVSGVLAACAGDGFATALQSIVLISPDEPRFWPLFQASPEAGDDAQNPLDRWSKRVIGTVAAALGGVAVFPSDGPPYHPFQQWAGRSGRAFVSPVGLLVHETAGLFISYRGAIALPFRVDQPALPAAKPCSLCARPCVSACPVGALTDTGYDVTACKSYLDMPAGADCQTGGCLVRRACPVGQDRRAAVQSAFHMRAFHPV